MSCDFPESGGAERGRARCANVILGADCDQGMAMPDPACRHPRTRLIARDDDAQYVECLDCGKILEAGEVEKNEESGFGESLSDA